MSKNDVIIKEISQHKMYQKHKQWKETFDVILGLLPGPSFISMYMVIACGDVVIVLGSDTVPSNCLVNRT